MVKLGLISATASMLGVTVVPGTAAFASQNNNSASSTQTFNVPKNTNNGFNLGGNTFGIPGNSSNKDNSMEGKYVSFNDQSSQYTVSNAASKNLSKTELLNVQKQVNISNSSIKSLSTNNTITVVNPANGASYYVYNGKVINPILASSLRYGHNGISIHWNYAKIYLSKKTVNSLIDARHASEDSIGAGLGAAIGAPSVVGGVSLGAIGAGIVQFMISEYGLQHVSSGRYYNYNYVLGVTKSGDQ